MDIKDLKVVIVNWNRAVDTIECVQSLLKASLLFQQLIIVDNGSDEGNLNQICEAFPLIEIHKLAENQGFTGGYNYGINLALETSTSNILLLNNDTIVDTETLPALLNATWDVCVPKIYFYDYPSIIWAAGAAWRSFPPMVIMRGYKKQDSKYYAKSVELEFATGCALLVRRKVFRQVGVFDSQFENYFEDYDFAYRLRNAGFHIGFVPRAKVWHKVSRSLGQSSYKRWWYQGRNSVLFYQRDLSFTDWNFYNYLLWVIMRELINLNFSHLPDFLRGVRAGKELLKNGTS
jgi:GT2 family glycosyltransferase